jgi:hypothetical protein
MAKGLARSPAYGSRHARAPRQRRDASNGSGELTRIWPEMRVARFPDTEAGNDIDGWTIFLNDVGGPRNYGRGKARALGSMAITFIRAKEFGLMLEAKYPKDYETSEKAARLVKKVRGGIRAFIRDAHSEAYSSRTDDIEERVAGALLAQAVMVGEVDNDLELFAEDEPGDENAPAIAELIRTEHSVPIWFGAADLAVNGINHYGRDGYGLDLALNEQLHDEHAALLHYLRTYEGLDTRFVDDRWSPHATFFDQEDHIARTTLTYGAELPTVITYNHPIAL